MGTLFKSVVALAVIFGLLYFLQTRVGEQKQVRVEKAVRADALR